MNQHKSSKWKNKNITNKKIYKEILKLFKVEKQEISKALEKETRIIIRQRIKLQQEKFVTAMWSILNSILGKYTGQINTNTIMITDEEKNEYMETDSKQIKDYVKAIYKNWCPETKTISIGKYPEWKLIYEPKTLHIEKIQQVGQTPIKIEELKKVIRLTANNKTKGLSWIPYEFWKKIIRQKLEITYETNKSNIDFR